MRWTIKLPAANTVAAGQTATFRIPVGNRLHWLFLVFSGMTVANITEIRLKLNASTVQRISGANLNTLNIFRGLSDAATSGIMQLPLDRVGLKNRQVNEMTAINTNVADQSGRVVSSVTLEVDIAAGAVGPVVADLYGEVSQQVPGGPGSIMWLLPDTITVNSSGEHEHALTPVGGPTRQLLDSAYFFSANVDRVQVKRDNLDLFDRKSGLNSTVQTDGIRVPQAGMYAFDPSERGYGGNMVDLTGAQDFRYRVDYTAAGDYLLYNAFIGRSP